MLYPFLCGCKTNHPKLSCLKQKQLSFWSWSLDGTALGICKVTWYDGDFSRCLSLSWSLFLCVSFSITLPVNLHYLLADCPIVIDNALGHKLPLSLGQLHLCPSTEQFLRLTFGVCSDGGGGVSSWLFLGFLLWTTSIPGEILRASAVELEAQDQCSASLVDLSLLYEKDAVWGH